MKQRAWNASLRCYTPCAIVLLGVVLGLAASSTASALTVRVRGNDLVDERGRVVRLLGVNRSGTEYMCIQGHGFFDGPTDKSSIRAIKRWHVNAVRVPLNEDCWLGINRVKRSLSGRPYREAIKAFVRRLNRAGLYVILELHVAAPGRRHSIGIIPMPDADHAPAFWRSVASTFASNHSLLFDLYNEPHGVGWRCWRDGCTVPAGGDGKERHPYYRAAGMQALVGAVRSTGATQPLMIGGLSYARDLSRWLEYRPRDPVRQLVASEHNYGQLAPCGSLCQGAVETVARTHPVVVGELGETDCRHRYIDPWMQWADRRGISYLGWAWNAGAGWSCRGGPSLIADFSGKPTAYGVGFRDHFRELARR